MMGKLNPEGLLKCMRKESNAVVIEFEVKPGAKNTIIEGIDDWRGCIVVRVRAPAKKGKANKELIKFLSSALSLPSSNLTIIKGEWGRRKTIKISGLSPTELVQKIKSKTQER
ncbi:MAG: YggU family protein [Methanomassiliicoccales archaeon]|nr:MAG: YggU family protein [Methanomassiliicoccales archaeon]